MDIYKIGVSLAMSSNAPAMLATITNSLTHAHAKAMALQGGLNKVQIAAIGAVQAMAGFAALKGLDHLIDKGNELTRVLRNMGQAGASAAQVAAADVEAKRLTGIYRNISRVEVLKQINDARGIFGNQDIATHEIEAVARSASFLRAYQGEEKGKSSHAALLAEMNAALKSGEIAGMITPEQMFKHIDEQTAMKVAFGSQLNISSYLTAQRSAGASARNWSDDFRYGAFAALAQENGSRAGTMLNTLNNKIVGGSGWTTAAARNAMNLGMLDPRKVEYDAIGRVKRIQPGGVKGWEIFADNPQIWVDRFLKPLLDKVTKDPIKQGQIINSIFPNQNAAKAVTEMVQQGSKFHKDAALVVEALKHLVNGGGQKYAEGSWDYQKQAFGTQVENLVVALGHPLVPKATEFLAKLNSQLVDFTAWASRDENGEKIASIGKGLAVLGGSLIGAGGVALLAALGPVGWFAGSIIAITGAIIAFRPEIQAFQDMMDKKLMGAIRAVMEGFESLANYLGNFWKSLKLPVPVDAVPGGISYQGGGSLRGLIHNASLGAAANTNIVGGPSIPGHIGGSLNLDGTLYRFGSGGAGASIPMGDYPITPGAVGPWGAANGALGINGNSIWDQSLGRFRRGIELHSGRNARLITEGCIAILKEQWPQFRAQVLDFAKRHGGAYLHVGKDGIEVRPGTNPGATVKPAGPPPRHEQWVQVHTHMHVDGRKFASMISRHQAASARHPTSVGGYDTYGQPRYPGTTVTDAA